MITNIQKLLLSPSTPVLDALRVIENGAVQIALVVDCRSVLLGTITDGDIRRALLLGETLDSPVERLMNKSFRSCQIRDNITLKKQMMLNDDIRHLPVLDDDGIVQDILLLQDLLQPVHLPNPVVIMAGGKGTRLRPYTNNCPKPMLLVDGKPMLQILIEKCINQGFTKFFLSVNYLKEQIIEFFGDGSSWNISIEYLVEDAPLGTAGSLSLLPSNIQDPFIVLNGDVLTNLNLLQLIDFHIDHHSHATLCVREHVITSPYGVVETNGSQLSTFIEKPTIRQLVNAGIYVIDPLLLPLIHPDTYLDMPNLLTRAQQAGSRVSVCPIHEYWIDVGRPETLKQASVDWDND